jgi:hypothetical protein
MNTFSKYCPSLIAIFLGLTLSWSVQAEKLEKEIYSIASDKSLRDEKRSVDVKLDKKVSAEALKNIALTIKRMEQKDYKRTFIAYYLPDMEVDSGAWATSHFNPELKVKILGLSASEEEKLMLEAAKPSRKIVGMWRDDRPFIGSVITIYREKSNALYLELKFNDGSSSNNQMVETQTDIGTKLVEKEGNWHGEYFLLSNNGVLQAGGKNGIFLKYKKLQ